jgi:hypothetical protein
VVRVTSLLRCWFCRVASCSCDLVMVMVTVMVMDMVMVVLRVDKEVENQ